MIRGVAKIRAAIALVLLSIPYLLLFAAGSIWLFQNRTAAGVGRLQPGMHRGRLVLAPRAVA